MNIEIIRGDTEKFKFTRKDSDGKAIKREPDAIYFTVKNNAYENKTIFQKTLEDMDFDSETGEFTFYVMPEDTDKLNYGNYEYDLEVKETIGGIEYVKTISKGLFAIKEEITFATNEV